jgi:translocator protein
MQRIHPTIALLLWLTASYGAGFIGTQGTLRGMENFYPSLAKPVWTPPAWLFSPVWTVLYALIGVAAWRVWRSENPRTAALTFWWIGLVLNTVWPWLFFAIGRLGLAFGESVALWISILATMLLFARIDRKAAWFLLPYLCWVGFATVLNLAIWRMN